MKKKTTKKATVAEKKQPAKKAPVRKVRKKNGQFAKGNLGRPRGSKNKKPSALVDLVFDIEASLSKKKKGLKDCAEQDPKWFYEKFLARILPRPVEISGDIDHEITLRWQR